MYLSMNVFGADFGFNKKNQGEGDVKALETSQSNLDSLVFEYSSPLELHESYYGHDREMVIDYKRNHDLFIKENDVSLIIKDGGYISSTIDAVWIDGDNANIKIHKGSEVRSGDEAITIRGKYADISNHGSIYANENAIDLKNQNHAEIFNSGSINSVTKKGIKLNGGDHAEIFNTGTIEAKTEGVEIGDHGEIINHGTIYAKEDDGINAGENIWIKNNGKIKSDFGDAIDIDSGRVDNWSNGEIFACDATQGAIDIDAAQASMTITNAGSIVGGYGIKTDDGTKGPMDVQTQVVDNQGLIHGFGKAAISLNGGSDYVYLDNRSVIIGNIELGSDNDKFVLTGTDVTLSNCFVRGGSGYDTFSLEEFSYSDQDLIRFGAFTNNEGTRSGVIKVSKYVRGEKHDVDIYFDGFEEFQFSDRTFSYNEMIARHGPRPNGYYSDEVEPMTYDDMDHSGLPDEWAFG